MVLRIGGPALVHAFHVQDKLPHASTLYKAFRQSFDLIFSYSLSIQEIMEANIQKHTKNLKSIYNVSMDEIAIVSKACYLNSSDEIGGFGHQGAYLNNVSMKFDSFAAIEEVREQYSSKNIDLARKSLIITLNQLSVNQSPPTPILNLPVCSHKIFDLSQALEKALKYFEQK